MGEAASVEPMGVRSFEEVYADERQGMVRIAYLIVRSRSVAEELVQDAFVRLHAGFDEIQNPGGFLRVALVRLCLKWKRRSGLESDGLRLIGEPGPTGAPEIDETWALLERLSAERRTAIVLRYYADLSHEQIATVTGWRVATVRTRVHRGLEDLRKEMDR
jgi:DNA-directed RNA polymerase specialized sigma24 family protein